MCTVCDKRFTKKGDLNRHRERHTGENVYLCRECKKCFPTHKDLQRHMNIHTSKYKCTECGKGCRDNADLEIHKFSHSEEKPFRCNVCNKQFTTSGKLFCTAKFTVERNRTNVTCATKQ